VNPRKFTWLECSNYRKQNLKPVFNKKQHKIQTILMLLFEEQNELRNKILVPMLILIIKRNTTVVFANVKVQ